MNGPTNQDISEMQRLINAMNGLEDNSYSAPIAPHAPRVAPQRVVDYSGPSAPDAADMKRIMEAFAGAAGDARESLREEATTSPRLREAMSTRRTDEGVQIGAWEVRVKMFETAGGQRKAYDVFHAGSKDRLYEGLVIFEAAHAIVRYLNKGIPTDHAKITEIADLEETFRRNRQDAVTFKKRFERCTELKESAAAEVFEARWQRARAQAIVANDQIKTILDNIR
jgi:hypothetical protein